MLWSSALPNVPSTLYNVTSNGYFGEQTVTRFATFTGAGHAYIYYYNSRMCFCIETRLWYPLPVVDLWGKKFKIYSRKEWKRRRDTQNVTVQYAGESFLGDIFFSPPPPSPPTHQRDDIVRVECAGRLGRISDFLERRQN